MKTYFCKFSLAAFLAIPAACGAQTLPGVHGVSDPMFIREIDAKAVRIILKDHHIKAASRDRGQSKTLLRLKRLKKNGVTTIVAIRWPSSSLPKEQADRIPTGVDRRESLELLSDFLMEAGPYIDWYQIQNEPFGGPGKYERDKTREALAWFADLTATAKGLRQRQPRLAHLRIMSPGFTGVLNFAKGTMNQDARQSVEALLDFSNRHLDAIDLHLHLASTAEVQTVVSEFKKRARIPLVTMEWSQSKAAGAWLKRNTADPLKFAAATNADFIRHAYEKPVSPALWREFVATAPHDKHFIRDSFKIMQEAGFLYACYGVGWQFGHPLYDIVALIAQRTVRSPTPAINEPFHSQFRGLSNTVIQADISE